MIRLGFQFALTSFLILNGCGAADSSKDANSDKLFTDASERVKLNFIHDPGSMAVFFPVMTTGPILVWERTLRSKLNGRAEPPKFLQV